MKNKIQQNSTKLNFYLFNYNLFKILIFILIFCSIKFDLKASEISTQNIDSMSKSSPESELKLAYYLSPIFGKTDFNYNRFYMYEPQNTSLKGFNIGIMDLSVLNFSKDDVFIGLELQYLSFSTDYTSDFFHDDFAFNGTKLSSKYMSANLLIGYHWKAFGLYCPLGIGGIFYNIDADSENIESYYKKYNLSGDTLTKDFSLKNSFAFQYGIGVSFFIPINSRIKFIAIRAEMVMPNDKTNEFGEETVVDWEWTSEGNVPKTKETGEKSKPLAHLGIFSIAFAF